MSAPKSRRLILWLASGFGVGYLPGAKGTYGSLVGVGYYLLLHQLGSMAGYGALTALGVLVGIWLAGSAEHAYGRKDAQEIVVDELVCFPVAMLGCEIVFGKLAPGWTFGDRPSFYWGSLLMVFGIYRLLDICKPSVLGSVQRQPGGWGIVADDLLAAAGAASLSAFLLFVWFWITSVRA